MEMRKLGETDLMVSRLGVGLSELGGLSMDQVKQAEQVLNKALDGGITFLDTAACYDNSEELIGLTVAHRRDEFVLASKCGHVTGGYEGKEWTAKTVADSIDRSLVRMKTDHVDVMQLHSCGIDVLERGDVIEALQAAQKAGKTRYIGYSGDNESAEWAIESGLFDTLQTSFNVTDQRAYTRLFPKAKAAGMGIIVKRPIANGAWAADKSPSGYANRYFERQKEMRDMGPIPEEPSDRIALSLGYTLAHDAVDTAIVGSRNPAHMASNTQMVDNGLEIAPETVEELHQRFQELDNGWVQLG